MSPSSSSPASARLINLTGHELRTPASVVIGYLRMLLAEHPGPLTDRQRKMLTEAEHSSQRLNLIIAEMSELSNLEAGTLKLMRERVPVAALLREAVAAVAQGPPDGSRANLEVRAEDGQAAIVGDRPRLLAALHAILHAMARERRDATTRMVAESRVETVDAQPRVVLRIGAESRIPLLAGPRGEFDQWRGGMGLSLPIAQLVIEAAAGQIWSPPGEANHAAVGISFPLAEA